MALMLSSPCTEKGGQPELSMASVARRWWNWPLVVSLTLASSQPALRPSIPQSYLPLIEPALGSLPGVELHQACEGG